MRCGSADAATGRPAGGDQHPQPGGLCDETSERRAATGNIYCPLAIVAISIAAFGVIIQTICGVISHLRSSKADLKK